MTSTFSYLPPCNAAAAAVSSSSLRHYLKPKVPALSSPSTVPFRSKTAINCSPPAHADASGITPHIYFLLLIWEAFEMQCFQFNLRNLNLTYVIDPVCIFNRLNELVFGWNRDLYCASCNGNWILLLAELVVVIFISLIWTLNMLFEWQFRPISAFWRRGNLSFLPRCHFFLFCMNPWKALELRRQSKMEDGAIAYD